MYLLSSHALLIVSFLSRKETTFKVSLRE